MLVLWMTLVTSSFRVSGSGDVSRSCSRTIDGLQLTHPLSVIVDVSRNCLRARDGSWLIMLVPFSIVPRIKVIAAATFKYSGSSSPEKRHMSVWLLEMCCFVSTAGSFKHEDVSSTTCFPKSAVMPYSSWNEYTCHFL